MSSSGEPQRVPEPRRAKRRRSAASRVIASLFLLTFVAAIAAGVAGFYAYQEYSVPGPLAENKIVEIGKGLGTPEIAALLKDQGVISDAGIFSAMAYVKGTRTSLKAGEYEFAKEASMRDVMTQIANGRSISYKLSVPEGWTTDMAVERIRANEVLTGEITSVPAEGAIMPDTYPFKRGETRQEMLDRMVAAQTKLIDELWVTRSAALNLKTKEEAVTLASIVEKETAKAEERPVIASVFLNRLQKNMRLQSDPTIIYGIVGGKGKLGRPLTRSDIRTPTPYNTYTIKGLPPGPIANPGRAALEAVLNPTATDYIYFVADGSGGHAFAATLEEHNKNVANWRKLVKDEASAAAEAPEESPEEVAVPAGDQPANGQALPEIETVAPAPEAQAPAEDVTGPVPAEQLSAPQPAPQAEPATPAASVDAPEPAPEPAPAAAAAPEPQPAESAPKPVEKPAAVTETKAPPKPGALLKVDGKLTIIPKRKPQN